MKNEQKKFASHPVLSAILIKDHYKCVSPIVYISFLEEKTFKMKITMDNMSWLASKKMKKMFKFGQFTTFDKSPSRMCQAEQHESFHTRFNHPCSSALNSRFSKIPLMSCLVEIVVNP